MARPRHKPFRARLKHFQRLGLPGLEAGKGARINYTSEQAEQMLLATLLSQMNVDPVVAVSLIKRYWHKHFDRWVKRSINAESRGGNPIFLALHLRLMEDLRQYPERIGFRTRWFRGRDNVSHMLDEEEGGDLSLSLHNFTAAMIKLHDRLDAGRD
jgi:hypothetical protein